MFALALLLVAAEAPPAAAAVQPPHPPSAMPAIRMQPLQPRAAPAATPPKPSLAPAQPPRDQVLAAVRAEWNGYDTRHQGRLGPLEFGTWVMRANGAAVQAPGARRDAAGMKPVTAMNATARAFAKADANHDGGVTPEEMAAFLTAR